MGHYTSISNAMLTVPAGWRVLHPRRRAPVLDPAAASRYLWVQFWRLEGLYMSRGLRGALWMLIIAMNVATLLMLSSL
jgi:hypothetical protein